MRRFVDRLVSDRLVMAVIVLNATALVLHEMAAPDTGWAHLWFWIDYVCVVFFLVEALVKIRRDGWQRYWANGWNKFDFTVVVVSLPALLGPFFNVSRFAFILILRLGRLFRLFRVLRFIPNLDHLVNLILAVMATLLFRDLDPEHFGDPISSGYSIFQVFTVEGWNDIAENLEQRAEDADATNSKLLVAGTRVFFVAAVLIGGILGLSLANAVFVDEMMMDNTEILERKVDTLTEEVRRLREDLKT
jgi:voltage-gated sodium channel